MQARNPRYAKVPTKLNTGPNMRKVLAQYENTSGPNARPKQQHEFYTKLKPLTLAKLLEPAMMAQARRLQRPVSVWVVDDEEALELAWRLEVDGLVTNRPKWAHSQVLAWYDEACAREGAAPRQELRTR